MSHAASDRGCAVSRALLSVAVGAFVLTASAAAMAEPDREAELALLHDIEKIVEAQEATGWTVDRYEIDETIADAVWSVCHTDRESRKRALQSVASRVAKLGGPLSKALAVEPDIDAHSDLVRAERVQRLLARAVSEADADCPQWLTPRADFRSINTNAERFTLNLEGGGLLHLQRSRSANDFGAGGSGRLLFSYGFNHHYALLVGPEFGFVALFRQTDVATQLPLQYELAAPIVLRHTFVSWHHDVELAPLIFWTGDDKSVSYGGRVGALLGISTARIRRITPWAGLGLAFEAVFDNQERAPIAALKGGLRLGFDWDY